MCVPMTASTRLQREHRERGQMPDSRVGRAEISRRSGGQFRRSTVHLALIPPTLYVLSFKSTLFIRSLFRAIQSTRMYHPTRGGARGGAAEFSWDKVKESKDREFYLGNSVAAPTGRWQDGRDINWYNKDKNASASSSTSAIEERREALRKIKEAETAALYAKLGRPPPSTAGEAEVQVGEKLATGSAGAARREVTGANSAPLDLAKSRWGKGEEEVSEADKKLARKFARDEVRRRRAEAGEPEAERSERRSSEKEHKHRHSSRRHGHGDEDEDRDRHRRHRHHHESRRHREGDRDDKDERRHRHHSERRDGRTRSRSRSRSRSPDHSSRHRHRERDDDRRRSRGSPSRKDREHRDKDSSHHSSSHRDRSRDRDRDRDHSPSRHRSHRD